MNKILKNMKLEKVIPCCLVGLLALIIGVVLLLNKYGIIKNMPFGKGVAKEYEGFNNGNGEESVESSCPQVPSCATKTDNVNPSEKLGTNLTFAEVKGQQTVNQVPNDCFPKDQLSPCELLPRDNASKFADINPNGDSSLCEQNFLVADHHVGINTVGQALRNANRQIRSEPPNPQVKVSPWLNTTIGPDLVRRPLEIGENCVNYENN
tara:strand:+ start:398 stop:1021 length:624 start_codon:yes stop_codon:yes gene_type:complete